VRAGEGEGIVSEATQQAGELGHLALVPGGEECPEQLATGAIERLDHRAPLACHDHRRDACIG